MCHLPKAVQVQNPSNVFLHSISEKSVLQLSKRYNRSWYKTPQTDFFLYSCEEHIIQGLLRKNEKKLARCFNFTFRYIDDVLSLNNSRFGDCVDSYHLREIYSICKCCWKVATYKWKVHNGKIEIISFVVRFRS
jgi:hypothetical protein